MSNVSEDNGVPLLAASAVFSPRLDLKAMKTGIHPDYVLSHVHCSCGNEFYTRSTKPELHVEICSQCHPFYTGKQKLVDTGGRVERFRRRAAKRARAEPRHGAEPDGRADTARRPGRGAQTERDARREARSPSRDAPVGGQAVLEGVMMRGVSTWAVAVRNPEGDASRSPPSRSSPGRSATGSGGCR